MDITKQINQLNNKMTLNRLINTALFCHAKLAVINNKTLNNKNNDEYLGELNMDLVEILKTRNEQNDLLFRAEITPEIYSRFLNPNSQLYKWKSSSLISKSDSFSSLMTNKQSSNESTTNSYGSFDLNSLSIASKDLKTNKIMKLSPNSSTLSIGNLSNSKLTDNGSISDLNSKFTYLRAPIFNSQLNLSTINETMINESSILKTPANSLSFSELRTTNNIPFSSSRSLSLSSGVLSNRFQINESFNNHEKQITLDELNRKKLLDNKENNSKRLHIHNIPFAYTENDLKELFKNYGPIIDAIVMRDKSGNSKGYGFITLSDARLAESSKVELGGHYRDGRKIIINDATPAKYSFKNKQAKLD